MTDNVTHERLLEVIQYNPEDGTFFRKTRVGGMKPGEHAGCIRNHGYRAIDVDGKRYLAHRLAWFYVHKKWPDHFIDHINMDRLDNRIANLREATKAENSRNVKKQSNNTSGYKGVTWSSGNKMWMAQIVSNGKRVVKYFHCPKQAHHCYKQLAAQMHGEFARVE